MAAGSTYTPIQTTTLGSNQATVTLSSIPSTYTDLILVIAGTFATAESVCLRFNSDSGTNYSETFLRGNGTSATSGRDSSRSEMIIAYLGTGQSNSIIQINNYSNTTTYKTAIGRGNDAAAWVYANVGLWRSTAAISSISCLSVSGYQFTTGTTFTLYGIQAA